jgi:hypothetical protein
MWSRSLTIRWFRARSKLIWVLVIVLTGVGAIVYVVVGRPSPGGPAGGSASSTDPNQPPRPVIG